MADPQDLTSRIRSARFTPVRLTKGYDMRQVDSFLDELVAAASAGRDLGALVEAARFATTSLREGYSMPDVDAFLDTVTGARAEPGPAPAPQAEPTYAAPPATPQPRPDDDPVVQEVPGLLARLFKRG